MWACTATPSWQKFTQPMGALLWDYNMLTTLYLATVAISSFFSTLILRSFSLTHSFFFSIAILLFLSISFYSSYLPPSFPFPLFNFPNTDYLVTTDDSLTWSMNKWSMNKINEAVWTKAHVFVNIANLKNSLTPPSWNVIANLTPPCYIALFPGLPCFCSSVWVFTLFRFHVLNANWRTKAGQAWERGYI